MILPSSAQLALFTLYPAARKVMKLLEISKTCFLTIAGLPKYGLYLMYSRIPVQLAIWYKSVRLEYCHKHFLDFVQCQWANHLNHFLFLYLPVCPAVSVLNCNGNLQFVQI